MNKRNITLLALAIAAVITGAFIKFPSLNHWSILGYFYFPSIILAVIISAGSHSPSDIAILSAFISYTLLFLIIFIVVYAILLEIYLIQRASHHLEEAKNRCLDSKIDFNKIFENIGHAINEVESSRRNHWVLKNSEKIDLSAPHHLTAANAFADKDEDRVSKALLKHLKKKMVKELGKEKAEATFIDLKREASKLLSEEKINK